MPNTSSLTTAQRTFRERSTGTYTATLLDEEAAPITVARITTLTLTLRNVEDGTIINSRDDQNVLNLANVTLHASSGLLTWEIQILDNVIVDTTLANGEKEIHRAIFEYSWDSGAKFDSHEILFTIIALDDVP